MLPFYALVATFGPMEGELSLVGFAVRKVLAAFLFAVGGLANAGDLEEIKSKDGRIVKAEVLSLGELTLRIRREDGKVFTLEQDSLDPAFRRSLLAKMRFKVEEDRIAGSRDLEFVDPIELDSEHKLRIGGHITSPKLPEPYATFRITRVGRDWMYLRSFQMVFLCDGQRIFVDGARRSGDVLSDGKVIESVSFKPTRKELQTICNAGSVAFKVGIVEFNLTEPQRATLAAFRERFLMAAPSYDPPQKPGIEAGDNRRKN